MLGCVTSVNTLTCHIYRSFLKLRKDDVDVRDISPDKTELRKGEQRQQPQRRTLRPLLHNHEHDYQAKEETRG
jgi:hypothetical protein